MVAMMANALLGISVAFVYIAWSLNRPLLDLVQHADRISKGELGVPLQLKRADEIGEIARSLERPAIQLARGDEPSRSKPTDRAAVEALAPLTFRLSGAAQGLRRNLRASGKSLPCHKLTFRCFER